MSNSENNAMKRDGLNRYRKYNISLAMADEKYKNMKPQQAFDKTLWDAGVIWFDEGLTLEDADDEVRNCNSFVRGFEFAKRLKSVNNRLVLLGTEWFLGGNELKDANENLRTSPYFIKGFEDALENSENRKKGK